MNFSKLTHSLFILTAFLWELQQFKTQALSLGTPCMCCLCVCKSWKSKAYLDRWARSDEIHVMDPELPNSFSWSCLKIIWTQQWASRWPRQSQCHPVLSVSAVVSPGNSEGTAGDSIEDDLRGCQWVDGCFMFHDKGVEHLVRSQFQVNNAQRASCKSTCVAILFSFFFCFYVLQTSQELVEGILRLSCEWRGHSLPRIWLSGWSPSW